MQFFQQINDLLDSGSLEISIENELNIGGIIFIDSLLTFFSGILSPHMLFRNVHTHFLKFLDTFVPVHRSICKHFLHIRPEGDAHWH